MEATKDTPLTDLLSSALFGGIFGFTVYLLLDQARLIDQMFREAGLSGVGGRIEGAEFVVLGALLGIVLDLAGKLTG